MHATPWEARKKLLNNPRVPNILDQLNTLAAGGIQFHGQMIVIAEWLTRWRSKMLSALRRNSVAAVLSSIALVPVELRGSSSLYRG